MKISMTFFTKIENTIKIHMEAQKHRRPQIAKARTMKNKFLLFINYPGGGVLL
jgi:hypothetical protein